MGFSVSSLLSLSSFFLFAWLMHSVISLWEKRTLETKVFMVRSLSSSFALSFPFSFSHSSFSDYDFIHSELKHPFSSLFLSSSPSQELILREQEKQYESRNRTWNCAYVQTDRSGYRPSKRSNALSFSYVNDFQQHR